MFKLSIVTVHLNDIERLVQTQRSLDRILDSGSIEWIVVDGGSIPESDAQMWLFEKVKNSATILLSEPDDGIFDAELGGAPPNAPACIGSSKPSGVGRWSTSTSLRFSWRWSILGRSRR